MRNDIFLVRVDSITYNHAPYIVDTMNGFTMQETTFPFICTIIDDASTDGEGDKIQEYFNTHFKIDSSECYRCEETEDYRLLFGQHLTNKNCFFAVFFLKYNHYSIGKDKSPYYMEWENTKYVAICEGDDYWIDPHKLQKQFDLLEKDNTISFCHHNFYDLDIKGNKSLRMKEIPQRQDLASIAKSTATQTPTMFFRNYRPLVPKELQGKPIYSHFYPFRLAEIGDVFYIDEPMAVYRRNSSSIYGTRDSFIKLSMALTNIDNMIYWSKLNKRVKIVSILKKRALKMCLYYSIHFLKRGRLINTFKTLKISLCYL